MLRVFTLLILAVLLAPPVSSQVVHPPDESWTIGRSVPDAVFIDDHGDTLRMSELAGTPVVISPVFTRCPHACVMITTSLRDALLGIGTPGVDYEVVTLTFDPEDTLEDLRNYREQHELPEGWRLARADSAHLDALLSTIDFNYSAVPGGGFAHANLVAVLTPDQHISGYVHGIMYEEDDIRRALLTAVTPASLVDKFKPLMALIALAGLLTMIVVLMVTKRRRPASA